VIPAAQVADLGAGSLAAVAILAAVVSRAQTGKGQAVDVSLFGAAVAWLPALIAPLIASGRSRPPGEPLLAGGLPQYGVFATADRRHVTLGAIEPKFFLNFLERVGREELFELRDRVRLRAELGAIFALRTLDEWVTCLSDVDTCFAPVNTLEETLRDPQVQALNLFTGGGTSTQISPPFSFSATPCAIRRAPPELGEHTREVLVDLGLTGEEIGSLVERKVV
jgi:crotonobetainyl-CoA:carnitine CoA-transferase CaiB-like acyl-CoA transferase